MKQIKNLIRKKVFLYIETNNIEIDPGLKEKYLKKGQTFLDNFSKSIVSKNESSQNIDTIFEEEDESVNKSRSIPTTQICT